MELSAFTIYVSADADRPGRYRWTIYEMGKVRDKSLHSFTTRHEAQADAERFVAMLRDTWQKQ